MSKLSVSGVLVIDQRPPYLAESGYSLLTQPVGGGSLLLHLASTCPHIQSHTSLVIVPEFEFDSAYECAIREIHRDARVCHVSDSHRVFDEFEPSDILLILDPSHFPLSGFNFDKLLGDTRRDRSALHIIPLVGTSSTADERVLLDESQHVRRIQRYYAGITNLQASGVVASYVSVAALRQLGASNSLVPSHLRSELTRIGVPCRDVPLPRGAYELGRESEVLRLSAKLLTELTEQVAGYGGDTNGVVREINVLVDPSAKLHGPVLLKQGCRIEAGATVIGPALIGAATSVGANSVVINSIIDDGATVEPDSIVCDRVLLRQARRPGESTDSRPTPAREQRNQPARSNRKSATERNPDGRGSRFDHAMKRVIDVTLAVFGLIILSPLLLVTALLVKLTSPGPIFFGHTREGRGGREFKCWKFRTMVDNAHALQRTLSKSSQVDGPQFKIDKDPRTTWVGRWLRATNVDELPQLFNVIQGHMSLIGPRPSPFRENQICVAWRKARLSVRPGITGLWQVCRHERSAGDFHQWIHYDTMYVRRWTFWLDVRILAATLFTLGGRFSVPAHWLVWDRRESLSNGPAWSPVFSLQLSAIPDWQSYCIPALPNGLDDDRSSTDNPADLDSGNGSPHVDAVEWKTGADLTAARGRRS